LLFAEVPQAAELRTQRIAFSAFNPDRRVDPKTAVS
jgi:hypothetical protein